MKREWNGVGNLWLEQDGDIPSCKFCEKTIDDVDISDCLGVDYQCCESESCKIQLANSILQPITETTNE